MVSVRSSATMSHLLALAPLVIPVLSTQVLFQPQMVVKGYDKVDSIPIDVSAYFKNCAFGVKPRDANFDGFHSRSVDGPVFRVRSS